MQIADGDLEILVIFEQLDYLEQGQQAVQACEFGQFQKTNGHDPVTGPSEEHDERDRKARYYIYDEPSLQVHYRDPLLVHDYLPIDVLLDEEEVQNNVYDEDCVSEKVEKVHKIINVALIQECKSNW